MHDIYQEALDKAVDLHKAGKLDEALHLYLCLLNRMPFEEILLYLASDVYLRKEYNGMAINLLSNLLQNNPQHGDAWCNLGGAFRKENQYERAKAAWLRAIAVGGETAGVCNNMATLYADHAEPDKALEWVEKALKLEPEDIKAHWEKALALLTLGQFEEGWKEYAWRRKLENWDDRALLTIPQWDGRKVGHLYIHGEQGIGDEVMFASAIPKMLHLADKITLEVHRKVAPLMKATWPEFNVISSVKPGNYDAKIAIGSLIGMFGFNELPYLKPHPEKIAHYKRELKKLGPAPYVVLTWYGGTKFTRCEERTIQLEELQCVRDAYTCVSGQYFDSNPYVESEREKHGLPKINDASTGLDLHEQAALFKAADAVLTVQQTAVHVAGSVGAKTIAMISPTPPWRYGIKTDRLPWYPSVKLIRRKDSWGGVITQALDELDAHFGKLPRAESRAA